MQRLPSFAGRRHLRSSVDGAALTVSRGFLAVLVATTRFIPVNHRRASRVRQCRKEQVHGV
jgi:hypothetical protein